jgi:hypothetical protein
MLNVTTHSNNTSVILPKSERVYIGEWTDEAISELHQGMIKSAIDDFRDGRKSRQMRLEAKDWLLSDDEMSPLSFVNCCNALNLDAEALRRMVLKMTQGDI